MHIHAADSMGGNGVSSARKASTYSYTNTGRASLYTYLSPLNDILNKVTNMLQKSCPQKRVI